MVRNGHGIVFGVDDENRQQAHHGVRAIIIPRVIRASNPRAADPGALASIAAQVAPDLQVEIEESPGDALTRAWLAAPRIVVAGSIFLLADAMKQLGRS